MNARIRPESAAILEVLAICDCSDDELAQSEARETRYQQANAHLYMTAEQVRLTAIRESSLLTRDRILAIRRLNARTQPVERTPASNEAVATIERRLAGITLDADQLARVLFAARSAFDVDIYDRGRLDDADDLRADLENLAAAVKAFAEAEDE